MYLVYVSRKPFRLEICIFFKRFKAIGYIPFLPILSIVTDAFCVSVSIIIFFPDIQGCMSGKSIYGRTTAQ